MFPLQYMHSDVFNGENHTLVFYKSPKVSNSITDLKIININSMNNPQ